MHATLENARETRSVFRLEGVLLLMVGSVMTAWTWLAWADPVVDFGREVYVPWRLSEGAALYSDVAYFNGPLSPYFNALWFTLFGEGIMTLVVVDLIILAAIAFLLFRILDLLGDRFSATLAVAAFLVGPAFARRNYNFVLPYSTEMVHGVLLLLMGSFLVYRFVASGARGRWAFSVGLCTGAILLTKPEIAVASVALPIGLGMGAWGLAIDRGRSLRLGLGYLGGALLPPAVAYAALAPAIGLRGAVEGSLEAWRMAMDPRITSLLFYRRLLGLDQPGWNVLILVVGLIAVGVLLLPIYPLLRIRGRRSDAGNGMTRDAAGGELPWQIIALAGGVLTSLAVFRFVSPLALARTQPVMVLVLLGIAVSRYSRVARSGVPLEALRATFLSVALLLPLKTLLTSGPFHYGFALALPGLMILIVAALHGLPEQATARGWHGSMVRSWVLGIGVVITALHLGRTAELLGEREGILGSRPDRLRTYEALVPELSKAMELARENLSEGGTILALPEGVTFNYLLRVETPTPFLNFMPPEVIHYGEETILEALRAHPPDVVLLVHKDTREYGLGRFGDGYGGRLVGWVRDEYELVERIGDPPFEPEARFGIEVLRRWLR